MTEEQKRILENIHKTTEKLMIEKAKLTLMARKSILEGNYPDKVILEQIRKIDEAISKVYRAQIENIRKQSKKIKDAAIKAYGNPVVSENEKYEYYAENPSIIFRTSELSSAKIKIDSAQFELYEQLFKEINNIEEEQRILWVHTHGGKKSKTDLEKILRANINDMQSIMPTLQEDLEVENNLANMYLEENTEKLSELQQDIQERQNRYGSQRNKILKNEKKEANKTTSEINELNNMIINNEAVSIDSGKSQREIETEAAKRKQEIQNQHQKETEEIKKQRREANEARRKANEEKKQENKEEKQQEKETQQIKAISKPKNKMSLKEKIKRVAVAAVAAVVALATGMGIVKGKSENKTPTQSSPTMVAEQTKDDKTPSNTIIDETAKNPTEVQDVATQKQATSTPQQNIQNIDEVEYTEAVGLWSTVKIGDKIYSTMENAVKGQNDQKPYFKSDKEYTVVGVKYSNGTDSTIITTTQENCDELEEYFKSQGYKPEGYMITTKRADEIDLTNINNLNGQISGFVSAEDIVKQANMNQGRGSR